MRMLVLIAVLLSSGCQLLTNFVRPLMDPVDAGPLEDAGADDAAADDAGADDAGADADDAGS